MIFFRHPVTDAAPGLCYGRLDLGLGPDGPVQIASAVKVCPPASRIVSSPAQRCRALCDALAEHLGLEATFDERLWEMSFGDWEGQFWSDVPRTESDPWAADFWNLAPPGGESFAALCSRVRHALMPLPSDTLVVAHGGVIRAARIVIEGANPDSVWNEQIPFATPIRLERKVA